MNLADSFSPPKAPARRRQRDPITDLAACYLPGSGSARIKNLFHYPGCCLLTCELPAGAAFNWADFFRPGSLVLCLNLAGNGSIRSQAQLLSVRPASAWFCLPGSGGVKASREPAESHRFAMLVFSRAYLRARLAACDGSLHPLVERALNTRSRATGFSQPFLLSLDQKRFIEEMDRPPVPQGARGLWYESKVLQLMADFFFVRPAADELFCDRQKRLARERVSRTIAALKERLVEPPSLEEIGRLVGCSPFHLSRTFSKETGITIPQYLRKLRMERAAELLKSGKFNVTEAALEVGYSSLSHFSQAFCQTIGCCPALYPLGLHARSSQV